MLLIFEGRVPSEMVLTVGFSLYWTGNLIGRTNLASYYEIAEGYSSANQMIAGLVVPLLFLLLFRKNAWDTLRRSVAVIAVSTSIYFAAVPFADFSPLFHGIAAVLRSALQTTESIIWFTWLLSHGKGNFAKVIASAALLNTFFTALLLALPTSLSGFYCEACFLLPVATLFLMKAPHVSELSAKNFLTFLRDGVFVRFLGFRFLLGALNCLVVLVVVSLGTGYCELSSNQRLVALAIVALAMVGFAFIRSSNRAQPDRLMALLASLPLVIVIPFFVGGSPELSTILSVLYYFAAFYISNIHLFRHLNVGNLSTIELVSLSTFALSLGSAVVGAGLDLTPVADALPGISSYVRMVCMALVAYAFSLGSLFLLASLLWSKRIVEAESSHLDEEVIGSLSERFNLTPRETEVFRLLARGYSRPYIGEKLVISQATVKTHVNNIYAKAGTNKHDSLLELVEREEEILSSQTASSK